MVAWPWLGLLCSLCSRPWQGEDLSYQCIIPACHVAAKTSLQYLITLWCALFHKYYCPFTRILFSDRMSQQLIQAWMLWRSLQENHPWHLWPSSWKGQCRDCKQCSCGHSAQDSWKLSLSQCVNGLEQIWSWEDLWLKMVTNPNWRHLREKKDGHRCETSC